MKVLVETERLKLREFRRSDVGELAAMAAEEDQMRFYPRTRTSDEASLWISRNLALYRERGFGLWLIESRVGSRFLGYCGIRPLTLGDAAEIEIGWHTTKSCWNQGIATEAATAARDLGFERFGLSRLVATIHPHHLASRRVAEKIGMHYEATTILDGDYPAVVYAVTPMSLRPPHGLNSRPTREREVR